MKNIGLLITIFILFGACKKKFEEGPYLSLKTASKRIKGNWELQVLSINGIDSTQYYNAVFKENCIFNISEPFRKGDYGSLFIKWGSDTTSILIVRLWPGYAKSGRIYANAETDLSASYYLYSFSQSWYSNPFDIRYLTHKKLILEIKTNENSYQRLELKKI